MEKFLYGHPVFRRDEFAQWRTEREAVSPRAIHGQLQHYLKSGRLMRVRRELYAVVPPNQTANTLSVDPYLIGSKLASDSVLAFHTALELHGVAYSLFDQISYISLQKMQPFEFQQRRYQHISLPKKLHDTLKDAVEVETVNRQGINIKVTSLARTYVDALNRIELCGGWEEVVRSISQITVLNIDRVIAYCELLDNAVLSAKVGYFLEQRQGAFAPSEKQIESLQKLKPQSPRRALRNIKEPCRLIKKWNLMLPEYVINRTWEEPDYDV